MKDPPPQKTGNLRDGGSIETAEGMEVSHAMWKVKQDATAGQDAAATVAPPDAIAQARAWEEGKHDVPIDIGSDSDEGLRHDRSRRRLGFTLSMLPST